MSDCCDQNDNSKIIKAAFSVALIGNPNCGKSTLFNNLTGARQRVGNWSGVTVERKSALLKLDDQFIELVDLPGIYSLTLASSGALDEAIACEVIRTQKDNIFINIVDATHLERHLYLTLQLIEMGAPLIVALNMMDVALKQDIKIDIKKLSQALGCPVIAIAANQGAGLNELKNALLTFRLQPKRLMVPYPDDIQTAIADLAAQIPTAPQKARSLAVHLLEEDAYAQQLVAPQVIENTEIWQKKIQEKWHEDADILIADARYCLIGNLIAECVTKVPAKQSTLTARIDSIFLNRWLGLPLFLLIMYLLFVFAINIGGALQDFFDIGSQTIFVGGFAYVLTQLGVPEWLKALLANGLGSGINTTITFIPVIGAMFIFLAFLEDSGYMARAAFVVDRCMRALGLPGKAFVPMIVGFGCNVPAVMAARTLENKRDRILTIMMSPFMSCSARLAIFAVFTTAFFPHGGQNIVFALYIIGILMAVLTGFILRKTLLRGDPSPLVMELPPYHLPSLKTVLLHAWQRLKSFIFRAGKLIVPICILIGALNALNTDGSLNTGGGDMHSILSVIGKWATPLFIPMGLHVDNWPATVGLITGILAKEVVVGTLNTLYSQVGHLSTAASGIETFHFWAGLQQALLSIPENFSKLGSAFTNPILAVAPIDEVNQGFNGMMYKYFDGKIGAFAYLLFILLYFPCVSTTAAMLRELHRGWSIFSVLWMTSVAYGVAVIFYQAATWARHPWSSSIWIAALLLGFAGVLGAIQWYAGCEPTYRKAEELT